MQDSISSKTRLPLVAIVGRPNVGKSTIFNRFIGYRRTITDPTPGVTRDPVEQDCSIMDHNVRLIDTGGFKLEKEGLDPLVTEKSMDAVKRCQVILFVMDVEEITPEDESFMEFLRQYSEKVILVVNKVDNSKREDQVWNYYQYGFEEVYKLSATHGTGFDELEEGISRRVEGYEPPEEDGTAEISIAILGKPNTGKSTLANYLTDSENSIVSEIPGTTRDVIEGRFLYRDIRYRVLDTAGIRRKKKVEENIEYYSVNRAIKSIDEADVIFLMIDAEEGLSDQDKKIASLIVKNGKGVILVLNKWDTLEHIPNRMEAIEDRTRFLFPVLDFAPLVPISALTGKGVDDLLNTAYRVHKQLHFRVETGKLNRAVEKWIEHYAPPRGKNTFYKVRYMTQIGIHPVRFLLFVNRSKGFPDTYVQFIRNRLRQEFKLNIVPIIIDVKARM